MARFRFAMEYFGKNFSGWQVQPEKRTVQSELEKAVAIALRQKVVLVAAGRTDAGVHARGQVAHFDAEADVSRLEIKKLEKSINALTEFDVSIRNLEICPPDFHARYHALYRQYIYFISTRPSPLWQDRAWQVPFSLDPKLFQLELECFLGSHDFNLFSIPRDDGKSTECSIEKAALVMDGPILKIEIRGNRFLHRMVRSMVGACYDVARKNRKPGLVKSILAGDNSLERTWAPAEGLVLEKVGYLDYEF